MGLMIFYLFIALSVSFLCSVLEAVLLSTPMSFVSMKENEGIKSAKILKKQKQDIERPISAILSLNTIAHTIGAAGVGAEAVRIFGEAYFGLISAILTVLILILSEIIPKTIGANYWRKLAMGTANVIRVLMVVAYPLVWLSEWITKIFAPSGQDKSVSKEEISAMVDLGAEEGIFRNKENRIIQNLIKLESIRVKSIMTPRIVVATASSDMLLEEFYQHKSLLQHSRIPLYSGQAENITGYVLRQKVFEELAGDHFGIKLSDVEREILMFHENIPLTSVWEEMLTRKEHIALVVDEYGSFEGVVTMEDILESILGLEILDEKDKIGDMQEYARERWEERKDKYRHLDVME